MDTANMEAFHRLHGTYIDPSPDVAIEPHGAMGGYVRDGLRLTDCEIKELRDQRLAFPPRLTAWPAASKRKKP